MTGLQSTNRRRVQAIQASTPLDWLVVLLSTLRRSMTQKRLLFNETCATRHHKDLRRVSDPYRNGHLFATLASTWTGRVLGSGSTGPCVTTLDSLLLCQSRRPNRDHEEKTLHPGSDYQFNLLNLLQDKGGTMNLRWSYSPKRDRLETLRRERGSLVPYRSDHDRRRDVLPKLWLQSIWLILYSAWRLQQQSEHYEESRRLKRKRDHGSDHGLEASASDASVESMNVAMSQDDDENSLTIDEDGSPNKKKRALDKEEEPIPFQNLNLNSVLEEEKARRLKAKAKEISLLQRFGLCLDDRSSKSDSHAESIDEEMDMGMNQGLPRKHRAEVRQQGMKNAAALPQTHRSKLRQKGIVGPALRCGSPSSVDRKLRRKRVSGDVDPDVTSQHLSSNKKTKNRSCEQKQPDFIDAPSVCNESLHHTISNTVCGNTVPESSHLRQGKEGVCEDKEDDDMSDLSFPQQDGPLDSSEEAPRSPIVYDDVLLTDRAKLLLENLERRRYTEVPKLITEFPPNEDPVQPIELGLPTVTPKLSKRDRRKLKKEAKKKKKRSKRYKVANLHAPDQPPKMANERVSSQHETAESGRQTDSRIPSALDTYALSLESVSVSHDTNTAAQGTYDDETCVQPLACEGLTERNDNGSSPMQMTPSGVPHATSNDDDEASPTTMLCSESFLEQWGTLIQSLASGVSSENKVDRRRRIIRFVDTDLIEDIDIEFQGQVAVMIALLSQTKEVGFETLLRRIVDLAGISKYKILHIFLCADVQWDDTATNGMIQLQNATMSARGLPSTVVLLHAVGPRSLASYLADCLLDGGDDHDTEGCGRAELEEFLAEPKIRERVLFLISIAPSMSLGNAFRLVHAFCTEGDVDSWFPLLISQAVSGRRLPDGIGLDPKTLQQLSFAISAPLAAHR